MSVLLDISGSSIQSWPAAKSRAPLNSHQCIPRPYLYTLIQTPIPLLNYNSKQRYINLFKRLLFQTNYKSPIPLINYNSKERYNNLLERLIFQTNYKSAVSKPKFRVEPRQ